MQTGALKQINHDKEYPTPELVELGNIFRQKLRSPHARGTCDGQDVCLSVTEMEKPRMSLLILPVTQAVQPKAREGKSAPDGLTDASRTRGTGRQQTQGRVAECPVLRGAVWYSFHQSLEDCTMEKKEVD